MFERFDDRARLAIDSAFQAARALGHTQVGTEHILLGILAEGRSQAATALMRSGATLEGCRAKVEEAVASKRQVVVGPDLVLTDRATLAVERAGRLSLRQRSELVEPHHLLLSVLDVEGTAGQVLRGVSADLGALRRALVGPGSGSDGPGAAGSGARPAGPATSVGPVPSAGPASSAVPATGATGQAASRAPGGSDTGDDRRAGSPRADGRHPDGGPRCLRCTADLQSTLAHRPVTSTGDDGSSLTWVVAYCSACGSVVSGRPR